MRTSRRAIGAVLLGGAAAAVLHDWAGIGGAGLDEPVNGPIYDAVIFSAGFACLLRARRVEAERRAWLAIAASIFAWAAAEVYWTLRIEGNPAAPYPSPADLGYLAFYPLAVLGLWELVRARAQELDRRLWMDGLIAALGTAALGAALIVEFVAERTEGSALQVATTLAYPLGDVGLIALLVGVVALTRWRPGRTWSLLLAGLATMAIADVAFTLQTYEATLPGGDWVEPIYLISALFLGAVAWQPVAATIQPKARFDGWREMVVPGIVGVAMIGLVAMQYFDRTSGLTTVLWSATMLAVIARLALSLRENEQLLRQVRTDQLTGLGSRGCLEVDLSERCARAKEQPLTVMLLDLNGFKRYNDNFGHPAGDAMLRRLAAQMKAAIGADAEGYRVGGDEFVVLIGGDPAEHDAVARRAAAAMSAEGTGYELSAAWGTSAIPEEAADAAGAMQLADARMYARKEARLPDLADPPTHVVNA